MAKPKVVTNRGERTVAVAINEVLDTVFSHPHNTEHEVWIATAYFNPGGFGLLADELDRVGKVRLLLGAEPQPQDAGPRALTTGSPRDRKRSALRRALEGHAKNIEQDRDLLGFEQKADGAARRLIEWLRSGKVEVRRYEKGFLHGKAFLIPTDGEGVVAGSSNFTYAGLARNDELNLGWYQPYVVGQVRDWFVPLWEDSAPYDLAAVYEERFEPHDPYVVYLRMLYERYGREVEEEAAGEGQQGVHLTSFQRDGVWRAKRILADHHGVVIADGVGLGKTFVGGAIIDEYVKQRRQRVLIIAPAALRDGPWRKFLSDHQIYAELISYEEFAGDPQITGNDGKRALDQDVADYALVVVDEGHAFRNPETQRAEGLRTLLAGLPVKDLLLLTATPVNNSLFDLYNLLSLFIKNDAQFADRGILSLRRHFAEAAALDPDDLSPDRLFDVLDAVAVRRTRRFVKDFYSDAKIRVNGHDVTIKFPTVKVEPPVTYALDDALPGFFARLEHSLDCASGGCEHDTEIAALPTLRLARYAPSRYLRSGESDAYETQLAGLLRSGLLKRFESSVHAFAMTCERMAASHDSFLALLAEGRVATGAGLKDWASTETDDLLGGQVTDEVLEGSFDAAAFDVVNLQADAQADRKLLQQFAAAARKITRRDDPKLAALVEELAAIATQARGDAMSDADERDKRKTIVFTYFTDTVEWIERHLADVIAEDPRLAVYAGRTVSISGDGLRDKTEVMYGFAPRSSEAPPGSDDDRYDLLISTDVLAEGVNLQQARHIVNYDLPWNPMRLVQRHGRIDRIGSHTTGCSSAASFRTSSSTGSSASKRDSSESSRKLLRPSASKARPCPAQSPRTSPSPRPATRSNGSDARMPAYSSAAARSSPPTPARSTGKSSAAPSKTRISPSTSRTSRGAPDLGWRVWAPTPDSCSASASATPRSRCSAGSGWPTSPTPASSPTPLRASSMRMRTRRPAGYSTTRPTSSLTPRGGPPAPTFTPSGWPPPTIGTCNLRSPKRCETQQPSSPSPSPRG